MSMQNNFIYVENVKERDLLKALQDLANLYSETGYTDQIKFYRKKNKYDFFAITFTNLPDFDRFSYFVNYLYLPCDLDKFEPKIKGFYKVENITDNHEFKIKNWVQLFMTKDETEADEVSLVNENNENYNFQFGGIVTKLDKKLETYQFIDLDLNEYNLIKDIKPSVTKKPITSKSKSWWRFW
jgi:hypothetical protein